MGSISVSALPASPTGFARFWVTSARLQIAAASVVTNKFQEIIAQTNAIYMTHRVDEVKFVIANTKAIQVWIEASSHLLWELRDRHEGFALQDWLDAEKTIFDSVSEAMSKVRFDYNNLPLTRSTEHADSHDTGVVGKLTNMLERNMDVPPNEDAEIELPEVAHASVHVESDSKEYFDEVTDAAKNLARIMGYDVVEGGAAEQ